MAAAVPVARIPLAAIPRRRVLVVEDDPLAARMLSDAFTARGFEVLVEEDGLDGLRRIADELLELHLVVTDLELPGVGGEELVFSVRHLGGERDLALVVASGRLTDEVRERLDLMGADAVLEKSLGPDRIAELAIAAHAERESQLGHG